MHMNKKRLIKKPKPQLVSTRISDSIYKKLLAKSKELEAENISETIRYLLEEIFDNPPIDQSLQYSIMSHFLIREAIISLVDDGDKLISRAEAKAKKVIEKLNSREISQT